LLSLPRTSARRRAPPRRTRRPRSPARRRSGLVGQGGEMRSKATWAFLLAVLGVAVYAANVLATPPTGFTATTLAKATYGEIFSHVHTVPASWSEKIQTKGKSDLYVQQNTWQPGGSTGWHTHPGPSFIIVTQGSVTVYYICDWCSP